jgi:hypothetical protein
MSVSTWRGGAERGLAEASDLARYSFRGIEDSEVSVIEQKLNQSPYK